MIVDESKSILVTWHHRGRDVLFITTEYDLECLYCRVAYLEGGTVLLLPEDFTVHDVAFSTIDDLRKSIGEDVCGESPFNFIEEVDDDFV